MPDVLEQFGVARRLAHLDRVTRPRDAVKVRETLRYAELFQHIWHSLGEEFLRARAS